MEINLMPVPNYGESLMKDRVTNKERNIEKFSRKASLIALAIVMVVILGGIILLHILAH
jgi:hypothetical protein